MKDVSNTRWERVRGIKKKNTKETVSEWIHKVMEPVEENEYEKSSISG